MSGKRTSICGIGINDANYFVGKRVNGKVVQCSIYARWVNMLKRCYDENTQKKQPTYVGCSVSEDWLLFSNFHKWMSSQNWEGKYLDKDILFPGNKLYSKETCALVDCATNNFLTLRSNYRGEHPLGVSFHKRANKYSSQVCNPFTGKQEHLGLFRCAEEAHLAWLARKKEIAIMLAAQQEDRRVADMLLKLF